VKFTLILMMLVGSTGLAFAQVTPSTEMKANAKCDKLGMTESQARYAADAAGFAPASNLMQDKDCNWMGGSAAKGFFMIDRSGKVTTRQP
jgi:hypothetical protein